MNITSQTANDLKTQFSDRNITGQYKSKTQHHMLNVALYGNFAYDHEEWNAMSIEAKNTAIRLYNKAQGAINVMKQEVFTKLTQPIFGSIKGSPISMKFLNELATSADFDKDYSAKEFDLKEINHKKLRITNEMIAERLVLTGIFPKNYSKL